MGDKPTANSTDEGRRDTDCFQARMRLQQATAGVLTFIDDKDKNNV
jgi:hypothetical protein